MQCLFCAHPPAAAATQHKHVGTQHAANPSSHSFFSPSKRWTDSCASDVRNYLRTYARFNAVRRLFQRRMNPFFHGCHFWHKILVINWSLLPGEKTESIPMPTITKAGASSEGVCVFCGSVRHESTPGMAYFVIGALGMHSRSPCSHAVLDMFVM